MKCSDKCPMHPLREMGRACQFKSMKDNNCIFIDVLRFVKSEYGK
jgi:hypothetical protein